MKDDFKKAVKKRINENIACTIFCGFFGFLSLMVSFSVYSIEHDLSLVIGIFGIGFSLVSIVSFIEIIDFMFNSKILDKYVLCKRCKCLINKNKIFCNECRHEIRRALRRSEDKQYFDEYKKMIKQKEKKIKKEFVAY